MRVLQNHLLPATLMAILLSAVWLAIPGGLDFALRPPWLDELHSIRIITDAELLHAVKGVALGTDFNPPVYHALGHLFLRWTDLPTLPGLRFLSLAFTGLAMFFLYSLLVRCGGHQAAALGTMALWAQPITSYYAFEIRFYAPWTAAVAGAAFFLIRYLGRPSAVHAWGLALSCAAMCTLHYFGIIALAFLLLGSTLVPGGCATCRMRVSWPLFAGPLALLACAPIYLNQRTALSVSTWIDPPDITGSIRFLLSLLGAPVIAWMAILVAFASLFLPCHSSAGAQGQEATRHAWAVPIALVFMPAAVVIFSYLIQPALIDRYAMPASLGVAALVAWLGRGLPRPLVPLAAAGFLALGTFHFREVMVDRMPEARSHLDRSAVIAGVDPSLPLVFSRRHHQWPVLFLHPEWEPRSFFLALDHAEMPIRTPMEVVERDAAMIFSKYYGNPPTVSLASARALDEFLYVPHDYPGNHISALFPHHQATRLGERVFRLVRAAPP